MRAIESHNGVNVQDTERFLLSNKDGSETNVIFLKRVQHFSHFAFYIIYQTLKGK
jgi:stress response protein SCP2